MSNINTLVADNIHLWTGAVETKSAAGRGSNNKLNLHGIKKLRELILELAVRGKLVPQDPSDEPASVLLKKITSERAQLRKEGKIKKANVLFDIKDNEKPFPLPKGWEYVRLNDLGEWGAGATPSRGRHDYYGGSIPWFKSGELTNNYIKDSEEHVTELALKEVSLRYNKAGDVLIAMYGATIGKTSILEVPATTNQAVCACTTFSGFTNTFLLTLLKAYKARFTGMGAGGAQPNISREKIIHTVIALPPTEEQKRIVAKVDELMALCDRLEKQTEDSIAAHQTLVEALLATLTQSPDANQISQNWMRVFEYFDVLFTTEQSIDCLKKTILQLAVMGKLVPQDPDDEPASNLLKKIDAEKKKLIKEGKIKKQKPIPEINNREKPFVLPHNWQWTRLMSIASLLGDGLHGTPQYTNNENYFFVNGNNLQNGKIIIKPETKTVSQEQYEKHKKELNKNTVLVSINGTLGNVAFYNGENIILGKSACYFNLMEDVDKNYIKLIIQSPFFLEYAIKNSTGSTIKNLGLLAMKQLPLPLPPKEEQKRIVTKTADLLILCDQLKERLFSSQSIQSNLAKAIVEKAVA